jgi:hypothetical protein
MQTYADSLLVVEHGALCPLGGGAARRAIMQSDAESLTSFADRVARRIASFRACDAPLSEAVIACADRSDRAAAEARREIASVVLAAMAVARRGRVRFSATERSSGIVRRSLADLAAELSGVWEPCGVDVSVRFGDEIDASSKSEQVRDVA